MNRWKVATLVFATLFVTSIGANVMQRASAENQPHMNAALHNLEQALSDLKTAEHDKGGWRSAAIKSTENALTETRRGIAFDNHH